MDALAQAVTEPEGSSERETVMIAEIFVIPRSPPLVEGPVTSGSSFNVTRVGHSIDSLSVDWGENCFEVAQRGYVIMK